MRRSEINAAIRAMIDLARAQRFCLPPFAYFTPDEWPSKGSEYDEIRAAGLGWDVTDFGKGDFKRFGLTLLTIRNGRPDRPDSKPYCEKLMMAGEDQVTPLHFHWSKTEDIINRGGGRMVCRLHAATPDEQLSEEPVRVSMDGRQVEVPAGTEVVLEPGQSITLAPYQYHAFWAEPGSGPVLLGEVSAVNDDTRDNRFLEELPRYPGIEEDESPLRLLCNEYPPAP
jgi:D-lyxose ketol-isomerase